MLNLRKAPEVSQSSLALLLVFGHQIYLKSRLFNLRIVHVSLLEVGRRRKRQRGREIASWGGKKLD